MGMIVYPNKRWRHDADGTHRYVGWGGGALAAVLGACGASREAARLHQYWWRADEKDSGYHNSLGEAKTAVERTVERQEKA